ncbi:DNA-methyltransferase [Streptacidiphilus sp. PAMC 29251]
MEAALLALDLKPPPGGEVLYASDRCTVIWGDCRDPAVIASVPAGYGLLCTDPPYGVNYRSNVGRNFDRLQGDDGTVDWPGALAEWVGPEGTNVRGLARNRHCYVFGYTPDQVRGAMRLGGTAQLIWDKCMTGLGDLTSPWGPGHEPIAFGVHSKSNISRASEGTLAARLRHGSVIRVPRPNAASVTRHPTEKPVLLMSQLIESSTVRGDLVVDPCAGSGSTAVAAVLIGRRAFVVEIDRTYAELTVTRVKAAEKIADQIAKC